MKSLYIASLTAGLVLASSLQAQTTIFSDGFESSDPGAIVFGAAPQQAFSSNVKDWTVVSALTLDVLNEGSQYDTLINSVDSAGDPDAIGGRFSASLSASNSTTAGSMERDTLLTFSSGTDYEFSFLHYQGANAPGGGRGVTAQIYDVGNGDVLSTADFSAVNSKNIAETRTISYLADGDEVGSIGLRIFTDTVDYFGGDTNYNFYAAGIDNISLVPEPGTYALIAGALALTSVMVRRRRK